MKKIATILGVLFLTAVLTTPALARGPGWGKGYHKAGYGQEYPGFCRQQDRVYDKLTEEQRDQLDKLHDKFYDDTAPLKDEMWSKSRELNRLLDQAKPDAVKALALQKEISDLKTKLAEKRINFRLESKKIAPELRLGRAFGRGYSESPPFRGPAPDMGWNMRGRGPGPCWD
jgi:zinc resistance-associated protein